MSVPATATCQNPVHTTTTWSGDPGNVPSSYSIFTSWSHMHQLGAQVHGLDGQQHVLHRDELGQPEPLHPRARHDRAVDGDRPDRRPSR